MQGWVGYVVFESRLERRTCLYTEEFYPAVRESHSKRLAVWAPGHA